MEIVKKPDIRVFASEAKTGEIISFPDILRGWGVTLDQTQGKPPLEWMNDAFNRIDLNNLYLLQQGIPEWDKAVRYPVNSIIKHAGKIYLCIAENENNEPSSDSSKWSLYVKNATTAQKGIVQLTNNIDDSEDKAITPRAVSDIKDDFDTDISALQKLIFDAVPVGVVKAYIGETAPNDKWLLCRGQAFSAESYPDLVQLLPDLKIPDLRGVALRGLDANRGFDPNRALLSYQEDAMQRIYGDTEDFSTLTKNAALRSQLYSGALAPYRQINRNIIKAGPDMYGEEKNVKLGISLDSSLVTRTNTQNETVMKNVAVNFIIKAR